MTSIAVVVILILFIFALAEFAEKCGGPADDDVVSRTSGGADYSSRNVRDSGSLPSGGPKQRRTDG